MKNRFLTLICLSVLILSFPACKKDSPAAAGERDEGAHPRLLLGKGEESQIRDLINSDATWKSLHYAILDKCNDFFRRPLLQRKMTGRRLLSVSRDCIHRVFYLAYAYRMTGEERFARRAEEEMLAVANFTDWNPSHFLDVAEMTVGMAIGYDWLYEQLPESARATIREAIKNKGLEPSYQNNFNWFLGATHNWNQVCNAGMTFGALAVEGAYPTLAKSVISRALATIKLPMAEYQPDGAYPEGYNYWGYGTSMNVLFLHAVEKALEAGEELTDIPGFLETAKFLEHMIGPSSEAFNWGDCPPGSRFQPAMFWFADKTDNPSLLWMERNFLYPDLDPGLTNNRLLPAIFIWARDIPLRSITEPDEKVWVGRGPSPVALMRTSWSDPRAIYLGFKAGSPSVNHGHMDIGSFVMEADGVRWASDFGYQNYESLESKGIQVFGRTQDAQRWTIFRFNNFVHNTLTVDGELQRVDGYATIDRYSEDPAFSFAISDISSVYNGQLKQAVRGVGIPDAQYVIIRDEIQTMDRPTTLRWTMLTEANIELQERGATLSKAGQKLHLLITGPANITVKTWSTAPGTDYDAPNPGTVLVGFECELPANASEDFQVALIPDKVIHSYTFSDKKLEEW